MQLLLSSIANSCGIHLSGYTSVSGGDINSAFCLQDDDTRYFLKINQADLFPGMFEMEAAGLEALRVNSKLTIPAVLQYGVYQNQQWLLLQWMQKEVPLKTSMQHFGAALAAMHLQPQPFFGWTANNYIGSLPQVNTATGSWADFYAQNRVLPLVKKLFDKGQFSRQDIITAETFCKQAAGLFPDEPPALLHGDLWNGNYMITTGGQAAIFDPAVYYGHREMDLGLTKLFGGFDQSFYDSYADVYALEKGWERRLAITQLYPVLVHAVLFGGHYTESARQTFMRWG